MNIWMQLQMKESFTASESAIADYLFSKIQQIENLQAADIAKKAHVSSATLYRLIDKFSLKGFADFKVRLLEDRNGYLKSISTLDVNFPFTKEDGPKTIVERLNEEIQKTTEECANLISISTLSQAAAKVRKARKVLIFTSAGNIPIADNFRFELLELGIYAEVPRDEFEQRLMAATLREEDFAILITFGGRGLANRLIADILYSEKVPLLLISSPTLNRSDYHAAYQLYLPASEDHFRKIAGFATRHSLMFVLDTLYACLFSLGYDANIQKKLEFYRKLSGSDNPDFQ